MKKKPRRVVLGEGKFVNAVMFEDRKTSFDIWTINGISGWNGIANKRIRLVAEVIE